MKKITILSIALFFYATNFYASINNNRQESIEFNERGITFFVFQDGMFDFNTRPNDNSGGYYYRNAQSSERNNFNFENFGTRIEQDNFGRIRRIGNTFINYDFQNRVSRIGSVFLRYNRFALVQVGGLQLVYNRFGQLVDTFGSVKSRNFGFVHNNNFGQNYCNDGYSNNSYNNENYNNQQNENDYYYYRKDGRKMKVKSDKNQLDTISN